MVQIIDAWLSTLFAKGQSFLFAILGDTSDIIFAL